MELQDESLDNEREEMIAVGVDFPQWMLNGIDAEAECLGLSRQTLVNEWIIERLQQL